MISKLTSNIFNKHPFTKNNVSNYKRIYIKEPTLKHFSILQSILENGVVLHGMLSLTMCALQLATSKMSHYGIYVLIGWCEFHADCLCFMWIVEFIIS